MNIQVLGSGCPTCKKLHDITTKAANELGIKDKVDYITGNEGTQKIVEMGLMSSPVLAVDGKPVMVGFIHDIGKIKDLLSKK